MSTFPNCLSLGSLIFIFLFFQMSIGKKEKEMLQLNQINSQFDNETHRFSCNKVLFFVPFCIVHTTSASYIGLYTLPCTKRKFLSFSFLDNQKNASCRSVKIFNKADKILNTKGYVKVG